MCARSNKNRRGAQTVCVVFLTKKIRPAREVQKIHVAM